MIHSTMPNEVIDVTPPIPPPPPKTFRCGVKEASWDAQQPELMTLRDLDVRASTTTSFDLVAALVDAVRKPTNVSVPRRLLEEVVDRFERADDEDDAIYAALEALLAR